MKHAVSGAREVQKCDPEVCMSARKQNFVVGRLNGGEYKV